MRAFVGAGGRIVVASHWPVPDDYNATERLISGLFRAPPGTATAGALRLRAAGADGRARHLPSLLLVGLRGGRRRRGAGDPPERRPDCRRLLNYRRIWSLMRSRRSFGGRAGFIERSAYLSCCDCGRRPCGAARARARASHAAPPTKPPLSPPVRRQDEAIVPDDQFRAAIPPLPEISADPDPLAPLDPITPTPDLSRPCPARSRTRRWAIPALSEPLPPLSSFDVQPAGEEPAASDDEGEAGAGALHPGRRGDGRDRPRRPLPRPFRARRCRGRGGQRRDDRRAAPRRMSRSSSACSAPKAIMTRSRPRRSSNCREQPGRLRVTLTVAAGNRYNFGAIAISGPDTEPPGMARRFLPLETGAADPRGRRRGGRGQCAAAPAAGGLSLPRARPCATSCSIPRPRLGDYTLAAQSRARARASPASPPRATLAFDAEPCRRPRPLPARRALRPPQGRRPARGDGLDAACSARSRPSRC